SFFECALHPPSFPTRRSSDLTDKIVEIPNASDIHGMRPQRYPRTGYVFANSEHIIPLPNDGKVVDDPQKNYWAVFTAIDGDTMKIGRDTSELQSRENLVCRLL